MNRTQLLLTVLIAGLVASSCAKKIGDDCNTNIDCQQDGTRICDLSQPGGYCTVDGCDEESCPSGSVCVRFFNQKFSTTPCDEQPCASAGEVCVTRNTGTVSPSKVCVPANTERRYCADKCGGDGDCRGAYSCQAADTYGSKVLLEDGSQDAKFCSPTPPSDGSL